MKPKSSWVKKWKGLRVYKKLSNSRMSKSWGRMLIMMSLINVLVKSWEKMNLLIPRDKHLKDSLRSQENNWMRKLVISMKSLMVRKKLEKCGLRDMKKNKKSIMLQMHNCWLQKVIIVTNCWQLKMQKLNYKQLRDKLMY